MEEGIAGEIMKEVNLNEGKRIKLDYFKNRTIQKFIRIYALSLILNEQTYNIVISLFRFLTKGLRNMAIPYPNF